MKITCISNGLKNFVPALFLLVGGMLSAADVNAAGRLDGIVAVVGDSIILFSELEAYTYMKVSQQQLKPDSSEYARIRKAALNELIDGKVLLVHAEKDTAIKVTSDEIETEVNGRINYLLQQNSLTLKELEEILNKQQGITLAKFKNEIRTQMRQEIIKQRVQQLYIGPGRMGKSEIEEFYNEYKDSLPSLGESVLFSKLFVKITPSTALREEAYKKIGVLKGMLDKGEPFETVAKNHSQGPTASDGGDLGFIEKGSLQDLNFEDKIFSLKPTQISDPFESRRGFHIIKIIERKGEQVHAGEIFVSTAVPEKESSLKERLLDSIKQTATSPEAFVQAVKKYSDDEVSKAHDGRTQWMSVSALSPQIRQAFDTLVVGAVSSVIKEDNGFTLLRIERMASDRTMTLADDWNEIAQVASRMYAEKRLMELVNKWKKDTYIDSRL